MNRKPKVMEKNVLICRIDGEECDEETGCNECQKYIVTRALIRYLKDGEEKCCTERSQ